MMMMLRDEDIPKCKTLGPFLGIPYSIAFKIVQTTTKWTVLAYLVPIFWSECGLQYVLIFQLPANLCNYILPIGQPVATPFDWQLNF